MEQYIGEKKVLAVEKLEKKTPSGSAMVKVLFDENPAEEMPEKRFEIIKSSEKSDATTVQIKFRQTAASIIFGMMGEFGIKYGEVNGVIDMVASLVNEASNKATNILFDVDYPEDRTLIQINDILAKFNDSKKHKDGSASTGSGPDNTDTK